LLRRRLRSAPADPAAAPPQSEWIEANIRLPEGEPPQGYSARRHRSAPANDHASSTPILDGVR